MSINYKSTKPRAPSIKALLVLIPNMLPSLLVLPPASPIFRRLKHPTSVSPQIKLFCWSEHSVHLRRGNVSLEIRNKLCLWSCLSFIGKHEHQALGVDKYTCSRCTQYYFPSHRVSFSFVSVEISLPSHPPYPGRCNIPRGTGTQLRVGIGVRLMVCFID